MKNKYQIRDFLFTLLIYALLQALQGALRINLIFAKDDITQTSFKSTE
jgi:hypothetical protein